jgi:hypothetical protein
VFDLVDHVLKRLASDGNHRLGKVFITVRDQRGLGPATAPDAAWLTEDLKGLRPPVRIGVRMTSGSIVGGDTSDHVIADFTFHVRDVRSSDKTFATFEVRINGARRDTRSTGYLGDADGRLAALVNEFKGCPENGTLSCGTIIGNWGAHADAPHSRTRTHG